MHNLYVINTERRNIPNCLAKEFPPKNTDTGQPIERKFTSISIDRIQVLLDTKIKEQDSLWQQLINRDLRKDSMYKLSFGLFSVFLSTLIAIITFSSKPEELIKINELVPLFCLVFVGMASINFSIIMRVISLRRSRILFIRQINSLRHAIDACQFAIIEGRFPDNANELMDVESCYHKSIGNHRKLPITNENLRKHHQRLLQPADNFAIGVISILTVCIASLPSMYYWNTVNSFFVNAVSVITVLLFLSGVAFIVLRAKSSVDDALYVERYSDED